MIHRMAGWEIGSHLRWIRAGWGHGHALRAQQTPIPIAQAWFTLVVYIARQGYFGACVWQVDPNVLVVEHVYGIHTLLLVRTRTHIVRKIAVYLMAARNVDAVPVRGADNAGVATHVLYVALNQGMTHVKAVCIHRRDRTVGWVPNDEHSSAIDFLKNKQTRDVRCGRMRWRDGLAGSRGKGCRKW